MSLTLERPLVLAAVMAAVVTVHVEGQATAEGMGMGMGAEGQAACVCLGAWTSSDTGCSEVSQSRLSPQACPRMYACFHPARTHPSVFDRPRERDRQTHRRGSRFPPQRSLVDTTPGFITKAHFDSAPTLILPPLQTQQHGCPAMSCDGIDTHGPWCMVSNAPCTGRLGINPTGGSEDNSCG